MLWALPLPAALAGRQVSDAGPVSATAGAGASDEPVSSERPYVFRAGLRADGLSVPARVALPIDRAAAAMVRGGFGLGAVLGGEVVLGEGAGVWREFAADAQGRFSGPGGAYGVFRSPPGLAGVMILEARGHAMVYVDGQPRVGDPYGYGYVRLPVELSAEGSTFVFALAGRGPFEARLVPTDGRVVFDAADLTLPDVIRGRSERLLAGVVLVNPSREWSPPLRIRAEVGGRAEESDVPPIPPLGLFKAPFAIPACEDDSEGDTREVRLSVWSGGSGEPLDTTVVSLRVRNPDQVHKRTFVSGIDGSVQYYAVNPAVGADADGNVPSGAPPAMVLSLHGASVEALNQAEAYSAKRWAHIVCPTNRRPFGFDWEDWGRIDALEVLEHAQRTLTHDPSRVYLTGHSMGGHGSWHLAVTHPDRFAAVAPSAGWATFATYAAARGAPAPATADSPAAEMFARAAAMSETLALVPNLAGLAVYILHGDADAVVPVSEARRMRDVLAPFHTDLAVHEEPGADHWWDSGPGADEPGAACVDWWPIFDLFARRRLPSTGEARRVAFTTINPGAAGRSNWARIDAAEVSMVPVSIDLRVDPHLRRVSGETMNAAGLTLFLQPELGDGTLVIELDGGRIGLDQTPPGGVHLRRTGAGWAVLERLNPADKGPGRAGPFKSAFDRRAVLVVGTRGTPEENAWGLAKARYDAETFWYRGNGAFTVVRDTDFSPGAFKGRSVVLYGNADTNSAWGSFLAGSPIDVRRGRATLGERVLEGDALGLLFVRPRPGCDHASVAAVAGTGITGMRATDRLPIFTSGVGFPDFAVFDDTVQIRGIGAVRAAGFFGPDWSIDPAHMWMGDAADRE